MPNREITAGTYRGHLIRKARKDWNCDMAYGWPDSRRCRAPIPAGSFYVEGDVDPDRAGGFGHERYCAACVDDEARAALAAAAGEPERREVATVMIPREPSREVLHIMRFGERDAALIAIDAEIIAGETPFPRFGEALARELYRAIVKHAPEGAAK